MHVEEDAGQSTTLKEKVTREQGWQRKKSYSDTERETMANANYYELLGVMRNAPPEVIRGAYKALAQKYHPDTHPGDAAAAKMMAALNEAARTLLDPARRQAYDEQLGAHAATAQEPPASESEERASPPTQVTKNWVSGWRFWMVLVIAGVSARLIGALASVVALCAFFWLQSRRGTVQAIAGAVASGLVVAVIASTALQSGYQASPAASQSVTTTQSSASNTTATPETLNTSHAPTSSAYLESVNDIQRRLKRGELSTIPAQVEVTEFGRSYENSPVRKHALESTQIWWSDGTKFHIFLRNITGFPVVGLEVVFAEYSCDKPSPNKTLIVEFSRPLSPDESGVVVVAPNQHLVTVEPNNCLTIVGAKFG